MHAVHRVTVECISVEVIMSRNVCCCFRGTVERLTRCNCSVVEALCLGVVFHEQDSRHSRQRVESSPQGINCGRRDLRHVVLQLVRCKFVRFSRVNCEFKCKFLSYLHFVLCENWSSSSVHMFKLHSLYVMPESDWYKSKIRQIKCVLKSKQLSA